MGSLSGGEKALVAAAFILAVGASRRSPVHVLDVIDGDLRSPGVHRVAMAIKELSVSS